MINDEKLKEIINRTSPIHISDIEELEVLKRFIWDRKGVNIGDVERPRGQQCMEFLHVALNRGINPILAMQKSSDFHLLDFMYFQACRWYKNKFKEDVTN